MSLGERWEQLEPRERTLLSVLGILAGALIILILPITLLRSVWTQQDENQEIRDMIAKIEEQRETIGAKREKADAVLARYANRAPPVAALVEDAAKENGITLNGTTNKPDIPHGEEYTERHTVTQMRQVGLLQLARTLEELAQSRYPVAITKLNIKLRQPDTYDVQLGVSAYDKKGVQSKETPPASGAKPAGAATGAAPTGRTATPTTPTAPGGADDDDDVDAAPAPPPAVNPRGGGVRR